MLDSRLLLACLCSVACGDGPVTTPTAPTETMIAPASIIDRTVVATIRQTDTRCTALPGTVIRYHFEDADTLRVTRDDGLFADTTMTWTYTRTGPRSAEIEITLQDEGRSEIDLEFTAEDRGTFDQRDFAAAGEIYCGDVTTLDYRGDFAVN